METDDRWRLVALASVSWFAGSVTALHFLVRDVDPVAHPISYYLNTDRRFLAATAFIALSATLVALAQRLQSAVARRPAVALGTALFLLGAVAVLAAGFSPTSVSPMSRRVHQAASVVGIPSMLVGCAMWAYLLPREDAVPSRRTSMVVPAVLMGLFLLGGIIAGSRTNTAGLWQRAFFLAFLAWFWQADRMLVAATAGARRPSG